jgi:hypothetical protein
MQILLKTIMDIRWGWYTATQRTTFSKQQCFKYGGWCVLQLSRYFREHFICTFHFILWHRRRQLTVA